MRKCIGIFFVFCIGSYSVAQMTPNATTFFMNWGGINPAHHGLQQHAELFTGFKAQWLGFEVLQRQRTQRYHYPSIIEKVMQLCLAWA